MENNKKKTVLETTSDNFLRGVSPSFKNLSSYCVSRIGSTFPNLSKTKTFTYKLNQKGVSKIKQATQAICKLCYLHVEKVKYLQSLVVML